MATTTAPEAAKVLGVGVTTLKDWSSRLGLGHKTGSGVWVYSDEDLHLLGVVRSLRDEDHGFDTIARRIRPVTQTGGDERQRPALTDDDGEQPLSSGDDGGVQRTQAGALTQADLLPVVQEVSRLALALSEASFRQGQLEAQNQHLEARAGEAVDRERVANDRAAKIESERDELRCQLDAERSRPWWRRLVGK